MTDLPALREAKCNQTNCTTAATHVVYWPGRVPPPVMCPEHTAKALKVMDALGLPLATEKLKANHDTD